MPTAVDSSAPPTLVRQRTKTEAPSQPTAQRTKAPDATSRPMRVVPPPAPRRRPANATVTRLAPKGRPEPRRKRPRHVWTQQECDLLRLYYRGTTESRRYLAGVLKMSDSAVAGKISRMGLCKRSDRTKWSAEDDEQLKTLLPKYTVSRISKIMHRSVNAVYIRAKRLKISCRDRDDWYTLQEAAEILGMDRRWVRKRVEIGVLKASTHYEHPRSDGYTSAYRIRRGELKNFIRRYPHELNAVNIDVIAVVDLLSGLLPV